MPIYDYRCRVCGKITEIIVTGSDDREPRSCPECGSREVERLLSAPVLLKGHQHSGGTCCGREERCDRPPCSSGGKCQRH